ncbi:MAG: repeat-containing protein [Verrucomicrobiales bacterium]|nr:repeat-containing protein [Verrucomicrobiales bacterium]
MRASNSGPGGPPKIGYVLGFPLVWILLVALLAMGGALRADFYMDDYGFILNRIGQSVNSYFLMLGNVRIGSDSPDARQIEIFQLIPTSMTVLTNTLFPMNPAAAHFWNLLIHLVLSGAVFRLGERLFGHLQLFQSAPQRRQAAFIGALIFACHPLGTEAVYYAKCHMVQLVALFAFWSACEAVAFFAAPSRRRAAVWALAAGLCLFSYFPGTVLVALNLVAVALFAFTNADYPIQHLKGLIPSRKVLLRPLILVPLVAIAMGAAWIFNFYIQRFLGGLAWSDDHYAKHVVTQGRVFWEYAQRLVIPVKLSSDHFQPWSTLADPVALVKLLVFIGLIVTCAWVAYRRGKGSQRAIALLLLLVITPFAMRVLYVNTEIMVEYRAYNALPWFGLLGGCFFTALAGRLAATKLRWLPAGGIVAVFVFLSVERGLVWRSAAALAEDSLAQYPLNNRARAQLQFFDFRDGNYAAVLQRHEEVVDTLEKIAQVNAETAGKQSVDDFRNNNTLISSFQLAIYAKAEAEGAMKALNFADQTFVALKTARPEWFVKNPIDSSLAVAPLLEARAAVEQARGRLAQ